MIKVLELCDLCGLEIKPLEHSYHRLNRRTSWYRRIAGHCWSGPIRDPVSGGFSTRVYDKLMLCQSCWTNLGEALRVLRESSKANAK